MFHFAVERGDGYAEGTGEKKELVRGERRVPVVASRDGHLGDLENIGDVALGLAEFGGDGSDLVCHAFRYMLAHAWKSAPLSVTKQVLCNAGRVEWPHL